MAKLLLINEVTHRPGINEIGDIVDVYENDYMYDGNEFDIVETSNKNKTKLDVEVEMAESITIDIPEDGAPKKYSHSIKISGTKSTKISELKVKNEFTI